MKLEIEIDMDNAAFEEGRDRELQKIFASIRDKVGLGDEVGSEFDTNGNRVCRWVIES